MMNIAKLHKISINKNEFFLVDLLKNKPMQTRLNFFKIAYKINSIDILTFEKKRNCFS